jgi:hypothetical protein
MSVWRVTDLSASARTQGRACNFCKFFGFSASFNSISLGIVNFRRKIVSTIERSAAFYSLLFAFTGGPDRSLLSSVGNDYKGGTQLLCRTARKVWQGCLKLARTPRELSASKRRTHLLVDRRDRTRRFYRACSVYWVLRFCSWIRAGVRCTIRFLSLDCVRALGQTNMICLLWHFA